MLAEFFTGPLSWSNQLEFEDGFSKGSKTREPAEKLLKLGKIQQQTQPTSVTLGRHRSQTTLVGGELSYDCAISAPQRYVAQLNCLKIHYLWGVSAILLQWRPS